MIRNFIRRARSEAEREEPRGQVLVIVGVGLSS